MCGTGNMRSTVVPQGTKVTRTGGRGRIIECVYCVVFACGWNVYRDVCIVDMCICSINGNVCVCVCVCGNSVCMCMCVSNR
jgi:hypothetical protein